jgi:D-alanyl-D-alanine carboxypeptidase
VVLGAPSSAARAGRAAQMFERGFAANPLSWLMPSYGTVDALVPIAAAPPNLREEICGKAHRRPAAEDDDETAAANTGDSFLLSNLRGPTPKGATLLTSGLASAPIDVYVGPPHKPGSPAAAMAATEPGKRKSAKPATAAKPAAKPTAHAAVAVPQGTDPAGAASPAVKPWPGEGTKPTATAKPATAKAETAKPATDKPKPTATLQPKPAGTEKPKPAATEPKPATATDKPKQPKPTVAAVKPKPAATSQPAPPRTEAQ